jgi:NADH:ubiquinone oxidoreductase subunit C
VLPVLKDDPRLDLKFLRVLFGVDHADEGMDVVYLLLSLDKKHEVTVRTRLPKDDLRVASAASVWKAADWHERETRDMFGIVFEGHPHLVPLLLPEDMTDHFPLRKDNPLAEIEEWQGELLGADVSQAGHIPSGSAYEAAGEGDKRAEE